MQSEAGRRNADASRGECMTEVVGLPGFNNPLSKERSMFRMSIALAFVAGATILTAAVRNPTIASAASTTSADPFWRCPSGYAFETSGSAVHCKKPAWTETKAFMPCVLPTPTLKIDLLNYTDICAGSVGLTITAEPTCYPTEIANGFTKRHVSGQDFCGKAHPAEIIAPNQMITF
jgi:hypothetical protein